MGIKVSFAAAVIALAVATGAVRAEPVMPWKDPTNAIVIDAYELNTIDWDDMLSDRRIAAFIAKASDGMPESFSCGPGHGGDTFAHCKTMWRKYAVSRELYQTRRALAKSKGLLWGAYHLGRPGNPVDQANHFLDFAEPAEDEMMVLDLEDIDREKFISLADSEIFVTHIKARTGRYPVLYTNHTTAKEIAKYRHLYPTLSRLPLWYARYKPDISGVFPMGNWESYALWQFSTMFNCNSRACPYRVPGTLPDIDVNVAAMSKEKLKAAWPFGELLPVRGVADAPEILVASADDTIETTEELDAMVAGKADGGHRTWTRIPVPSPAPREMLVAAAAPTATEESTASAIPVPQPSPLRLEREIAGLAAVAMPAMPTQAPHVGSVSGADVAYPPEPLATASIPAAAPAAALSPWMSAYAPARFPPNRAKADAAFAAMLGRLPSLPASAPRIGMPYPDATPVTGPRKAP